MSNQHPAVIDPELRRQLAAVGKDQPIEAVFTLRTPDPSAVLDTKDVHRAVDRIVKSAQDACGLRVKDLNVMPRVQAFALSAPAGVVEAILDSADIASAMANAQPEDLAIHPVPRPSGKGGSRGGGKPRKGG